RLHRQGFFPFNRLGHALPQIRRTGDPRQTESPPRPIFERWEFDSTSRGEAALAKRVKQRLGLDQISGAEALREPAADGCQQVLRTLPFAATRPQPREARGGTEFKDLRLLLMRDIEGGAETDLDLLRRAAAFCGKEFASNAMKLGTNRAFFELSGL